MATDLNQLRADFEAIAPKYDITTEPRPTMLEPKPEAPFKYAHSNHLFAIFCEGAARCAVPAQASAPEVEPVAKVTHGTVFGPGLAFLANGKDFPKPGTLLYAAPVPAQGEPEATDKPAQ